MNYYPFHLGDYASHTAHLEPMEDLAYRRMLDVYYLREGPLPADVSEVARLVRMRSNASDVEAVLREFFVLTDEGWRHDRCDNELSKMQDKQAKAKASAAASVKARSTNAQRTLNERSTNAEQTPSDRSTDAELPTPTPTPIDIPPTPKGVVPPAKKREQASPVNRPDDVKEQTWSDWVAHRKAKKATVTQTVLDGARAESVKAGMTLDAFLALWCRRGSQGLEASWIKPSERADVGRESFRERDARLAAERVAIATGGLAHDKSAMRPQRVPDFHEILEGEAHEQARIA